MTSNLLVSLNNIMKTDYIYIIFTDPSWEIIFRKSFCLKGLYISISMNQYAKNWDSIQWPLIFNRNERTFYILKGLWGGCIFKDLTAKNWMEVNLSENPSIMPIWFLTPRVTKFMEGLLDKVVYPVYIKKIFFFFFFFYFFYKYSFLW